MLFHPLLGNINVNMNIGVKIMKTAHHIRLTSAELSNLWNTYMNDSMTICVLKYFLKTVKDTQIQSVVEYALELCKKHIQRLHEIYNQENHPIPKGFRDEDVDLGAPRLFDDSFFLYYVKQMARIGIGAHGLALALSARSDIRSFYLDCSHEALELDNKATELLLSKGLYVRAPYTDIPEKVEFVQKQGFLGDLLGEQRPLLAVEITHLYANIQTNALGRALLMGFSQVAESKEVRNYMVRGRDIASKQIEVLQSILHKSHVKSPMTWNDTVMESTVSPFSDKLMMFHVGAITSVGIADYGTSISISLRKDLSAAYARLLAEGGQYAEDGANIMIEHGWMEQAPQAADRDALAKV
jgi:hypothetical protein